MKKILSLSIAILLYSSSFGQLAPKWVNPALRAAMYPESTYLSGFSSEINYNNQDPAEMLQRLEKYAKDQLIENIQVEIKSQSTLNIKNVNTKTQEEFKRTSTSFSKAQLAGLKTENFYDKKTKAGYVIAYVSKAETIGLYDNNIQGLLEQIKNTLELAQNQISQKNNQDALKNLFICQTLIRQIEEAQTILMIVQGDFNSPKLKFVEVQKFRLDIDNNLSGIKNNQQFSIDDAVFFLVSGLQSQNPSLDLPVRVMNFTFQETPIGSPFSRRLASNLEQKLVQVAGYKVANTAQGENAYVLSGTYWKEGERIKIISILRDQATSRALGSVECYLPIQALSSIGVEFIPENYQNALSNMEALSKDEIKGGDLQIDVYTNKGRENLIYTEGDPLKLFVRANRECYLRFVYHLADGSKVLLLDNYYINIENVNKVYELPYKFECAEPFGVETLQLNAQSKQFESLYTQEEGGYLFIKDDTQSFITKTRGFKGSTKAEDLKAEKRIVITTMAK